MYLTPTEADRLQIFQAAELARRVRERGNRLSAPEAIALMCDEMHLAARDGATYEAVLLAGKRAVALGEVIEGVEYLSGMSPFLIARLSGLDQRINQAETGPPLQPIPV